MVSEWLENQEAGVAGRGGALYFQLGIIHNVLGRRDSLLRSELTARSSPPQPAPRSGRMPRRPRRTWVERWVVRRRVQPAAAAGETSTSPRTYPVRPRRPRRPRLACRRRRHLRRRPAADISPLGEPSNPKPAPEPQPPDDQSPRRSGTKVLLCI